MYYKIPIILKYHVTLLIHKLYTVTVTVLNGSSVLLKWSAPYTLDNVPITGYNISDDEGILLDTDTVLLFQLTITKTKILLL